MYKRQDGFWSTAVTLVVLAGLSALESAVHAEQPATSPSINTALLDGQSFAARIVRDDTGEDGPLEDRLVFKDGTFASAICERYNFQAAPYWVRVEGDEIQFISEMFSPTDGRMLWKGAIRDGALEGTMRWTRERWYWTIDAEHTIRGELMDTTGSAPPAN